MVLLNYKQGFVRVCAESVSDLPMDICVARTAGQAGVLSSFRQELFLLHRFSM